MAYEKRDAAFAEWLEDTYPAHSQYDHDTLGDYKNWLENLKSAFNAGWEARKKAVDYAITR